MKLSEATTMQTRLKPMASGPPLRSPVSTPKSASTRLISMTAKRPPITAIMMRVNFGVARMTRALKSIAITKKTPKVATTACSTMPL